MDYEKILKGIVQIINTTEKSDIGFVDICTYIGKNCPELAESEDEKISREITEFILTHRIDEPNDIEDTNTWLAWLEKQGEQKPTDKTKPKFKVGDWITDGYLHNKITDVLEDRYIVETKFVKRSAILYDYESRYHLWTIADAKDGDVLAFSNDIVVIFKDLYNSSSFHYYCHIEDGEFGISEDDMPDWWEGKGFHPATKEQRDLLFSKMKEAGYEWDDENKEVKKIEKQAPKTKWSEEDAFRTKTLNETVIGGGSIRLEMRNEYMDWLKSLKQRLGGEE